MTDNVKKSSKDNLSEDIKKWNEYCFPPNKEEITYNSVIFLEVFSLEEFSLLKEGLDKLYTDAPPHIKNGLKYKEVLKNKLFGKSILNLGYIINLNLNGKIFATNGVYHNFDTDIRHLHLTLIKILPSTAVLQVQVTLDKSVSDKLNKIIYKYHSETDIKDNIADNSFFHILLPEKLKNQEISNLKRTIKKSAIEFLSKYFSGKFFMLYKEDEEVIPSIDLFSLNKFPSDIKKIEKWINNNHGFLQCLDLNDFPYTTFSYQCFLLFENRRKSRFANYAILVDKDRIDTRIDPDREAVIGIWADSIYFDLIAIDRWIETQERFIEYFNSVLTEQYQKFEKVGIKSIIKTREDISENIFQLNRLNFEFELYFPFYKLKFVSLRGNILFFENLINKSKEKLKIFYKTLSILNKHSTETLALKNISYNESIQELLIVLTIAVILLSLLQLFASVASYMKL